MPLTIVVFQCLDEHIGEKTVLRLRSTKSSRFLGWEGAKYLPATSPLAAYGHDESAVYRDAID